jgi:hypothetical protein
MDSRFQTVFPGLQPSRPDILSLGEFRHRIGLNHIVPSRQRDQASKNISFKEKFMTARQKTWSRAGVVLALATVSLGQHGFAQNPSPDFHIYLAFGQSNMEGNGQVPAAEKTGVNPRFQLLPAVNCPAPLNRTKGTWVTAVPPLCRCGTGMTPADYFGRTLVDSLPAHIKVGVIHVAVAGCAIEMFDKDKYQSYITGQADWMKNIANEYGGNPYGTLVTLAKQAQKEGVIKGFLLHQGESGSSTNQWANEVKIIYNNLINDLSLDAAKTPLLAGDLVNTSTMVKNLPNTLPNSYVISSQGLGKNSDNLHFSPEGYKEFGKRYGATMYGILKQNGSVGLQPGAALPGYALGDRLDWRNGKASVGFEVLRPGFVSVKAYTLGGEEIAELAGKAFPAGRHTLEFANKLPSAGICILKMEAGAFSATRRVVLGAR